MYSHNDDRMFEHWGKLHNSTLVVLGAGVGVGMGVAVDGGGA